MSHALVLGMFEHASAAADAARALRALGVARDRVSIVAKSHDEEGVLANAAGASPGSEIEDSRPASRLGELGAHFLAAIAIVMPGIGPIVADGPLAAGLGEAAGHLAGSIAGTLEDAGLDGGRAKAWESAIEAGAILVGAHVGPEAVYAAEGALREHGASEVAEVTWPD
jgi:hypothetical protein